VEGSCRRHAAAAAPLLRFAGCRAVAEARLHYKLRQNRRNIMVPHLKHVPAPAPGQELRGVRPAAVPIGRASCSQWREPFAAMPSLTGHPSPLPSQWSIACRCIAFVRRQTPPSRAHCRTIEDRGCRRHRDRSITTSRTSSLQRSPAFTTALLAGIMTRLMKEAGLLAAAPRRFGPSPAGAMATSSRSSECSSSLVATREREGSDDFGALYSAVATWHSVGSSDGHRTLTERGSTT